MFPSDSSSASFFQVLVGRRFVLVEKCQKESLYYENAIFDSSSKYVKLRRKSRS